MRELGCCLVTGGAGWVGKHLIERLSSVEASLGVTRVVSADVETTAGGALLDVTDRAAVLKLVTALRPDTIFHLAAVVDIRPEAGERCAPVNVEGTRNVIDAAARVGASVVHCSSHDVTFHSADESNLRPCPPGDLQLTAPCHYAASKAAGELAALEAPEGASVVVIRPAHVFGPGDPVAAHMRQFPPLQIGPGGAQMSMVSIETLVTAFLLAAQRTESLAGKCYFVKDLDYNFCRFYQVSNEPWGGKPLACRLEP